MLFKSLLLAALLFPITAATPMPDAVPGGPPRVSLAGKSDGGITKAELARHKTVDLVGCVPTARITKLSICIKDCEGKNAGYTSKSSVLTADMRTMLNDLPTGTPFTVRVTVVDDTGRDWDVPDAEFLWKG